LNKIDMSSVEMVEKLFAKFFNLISVNSSINLPEFVDIFYEHNSD